MESPDSERVDDATARHIADLLAAHYDQPGVEVAALPGERDLNFLIARDARPFAVLKVMHAGCPESQVDLQCAALAHVHAHAPQCALPRVLARGDGAPFGMVDWFGEARIAFALSYLDGRRQATLPPLDGSALEALGRAVGSLVTALSDFQHAELDRPLEWNLTRAAEHTRDCHHIDTPLDRTAAGILARFGREAVPLLRALPGQAIHNDLNDHNVLLRVHDYDVTVRGFVDVGDLARQPALCELAIACAYSAMRQDDPVAACVALARGFHAQHTLSADEADLLPLLVKARLCVSLAIAARRHAAGAADEYALVSQAGAAQLLQRLEDTPEPVFALRLRAGLGLPGLPHRERVLRYLDSAQPRPVIAPAAATVVDLGVGSQLLGADPANGALVPLGQRIERACAAAGAVHAYGRYLEPRLLYAAAGFGGGHRTDEKRTVHLGLDVFCAAGTEVRAPLAGRVFRCGRLDRPLDYGPVLMLQHDLPDGESFFTLYGHLDPTPALDWREGDRVDAGALIARVGAPPDNGGWPAHLHCQLILSDMGLGLEFPGVCYARDRAAYAQLCPNPAALLGIADAESVAAHTRDAELLARRSACIGPSLSLSYRKPIHIERGFGAYLYDSDGRALLDFYNNVAHVGHSHPHVVQAATAQLALLNTNTRYLHTAIVDYAQRLCSYLPAPLTVCYFVNSASEANELALRMARAATGRQDVLVTAGAYHGHTSALIDMSPYKYNGPGGAGPPPWVTEVPIPDPYRGTFGYEDAAAGPRYAQTVTAAIERAGDSAGFAAFFAETMPSVGGQIIPPQGYLAGVYAAVRAHGGLCVADEVQTGFGRLGAAFFGFETQGVVPDIVVLGKPIANGFPMGAVVTTPDIAAAFDNGMEFFATFGGNPVACAAAAAVLDVLEDEQLPARAERLGRRLRAGLADLADRFALIGDVRGMGLFLGVELVRNRATLQPAARAAADLVERLRCGGVLAGVDGPLHNVVKLRPTLATSDDDVAFALTLFERCMAQTQLLHDAGGFA